jgi:hypothetical protein
MIYETIDYSIFKKSDINRDLNEGNLKKITASIKAKNLLSYRPIIVNSKMEVIDGQHRLEVAKALNIPIYYQINEKSNDEDMVLLNANQRRWQIADYNNHFVKMGKPEYIKLNEFTIGSKLSIQECLSLMGFSGGSNCNVFRCGKFKFPTDIMHIKNRLRIIKDVKFFICEKFIGNSKFLNHVNFTKACIQFLSRGDVDEEVFMKKLEMNLQWLRCCSVLGDYLSIFKRIYNFKNQAPIE